MHWCGHDLQARAYAKWPQARRNIGILNETAIATPGDIVDFSTRMQFTPLIPLRFSSCYWALFFFVPDEVLFMNKILKKGNNSLCM